MKTEWNSQSAVSFVCPSSPPKSCCGMKQLCEKSQISASECFYSRSTAPTAPAFLSCQSLDDQACTSLASSSLPRFWRAVIVVLKIVPSGSHLHSLHLNICKKRWSICHKLLHTYYQFVQQPMQETYEDGTWTLPMHVFSGIFVSVHWTNILLRFMILLLFRDIQLHKNFSFLTYQIFLATQLSVVHQFHPIFWAISFLRQERQKLYPAEIICE